MVLPSVYCRVHCESKTAAIANARIAMRLDFIIPNYPPFQAARKRLSHRQEPLHAFAGEDLASVDDAFGIHRDHVQAEELAAIFAHAAHFAD